MSENETKGRCRRQLTESYADNLACVPRYAWITADAIDRIAADVAAVKAKVDSVAPEDVRHFVESEKAWVALVEEQRDAAIRERDEARKERDEARVEAERRRMQLAVCAVLADSNTTESLERDRQVHPDYDCAAVQSVIRAVEREIAVRSEVERHRMTQEERRTLEECADAEAVARTIWSYLARTAPKVKL